MQTINHLLVKTERLLHPKIKELIAKSLVYFFTLKEMKLFSQNQYLNESHLLIPFEKPLNIAHRGFSGKYPENTLVAFEKALAEDVDMVELDITLSKDGEIVVFHDPTLIRLAGVDQHIRDLSFSEIDTLEVGSWFQATHAGLKIPKLSDVFEIIDQSTLINIEIKHEATSFVHWQTEKKLLALIEEYKMQNQVVISCFNPMVVNRIRKLAPGISTAYLITQSLNPLLIFLLAKINAQSVHVDFKYLNAKNVTRMKAAGLKVMTYTLNSAQEYETALSLGVDGILSDHPDQLKQYLAKVS